MTDMDIKQVRKEEQSKRVREREKEIEESRSILRRAEMKRSFEKLTKKELCTIFGFNYNFYMNCVSGRNAISKKMESDLRVYLEMETNIVHKKVFESRESEESFHDNLNIDEDEFNSFIEELSKRGILK